jgi:hypothetical protein
MPAETNACAQKQHKYTATRSAAFVYVKHITKHKHTRVHAESTRSTERTNTNTNIIRHMLVTLVKLATNTRTRTCTQGQRTVPGFPRRLNLDERAGLRIRCRNRSTD